MRDRMVRVVCPDGCQLHSGRIFIAVCPDGYHGMYERTRGVTRRVSSSRTLHAGKKNKNTAICECLKLYLP